MKFLILCFLIFYSHNLSRSQDSYGRLGPNYNGAVLALELEPVSWLDVEPKAQKRHPEVSQKEVKAGGSEEVNVSLR